MGREIDSLFDIVKGLMQNSDFPNCDLEVCFYTEESRRTHILRFMHTKGMKNLHIYYETSDHSETPARRRIEQYKFYSGNLPLEILVALHNTMDYVLRSLTDNFPVLLVPLQKLADFSSGSLGISN